MRLEKLDYARSDVFLCVESSFESEFRTRSCWKEPMTVDWIEQNLRPDDVFYDIGANIGAYSLIAAKYGKGYSKVYAFEPAFTNFYQLCRNIVQNACTNCITPLSLAACRRSQLDYLNYKSLEMGAALHAFATVLDYKAEEFSPILSLPTLGISIDEFVRIKNVAPPTMMKVDVDGTELEVLQGAADVLARKEFRTVLIEINESLKKEANDILSFLSSCGLYAVVKDKLTLELFNYTFSRNSESVRARTIDEVPLGLKSRI
jgi:FkbM family methyltransferase